MKVKLIERVAEKLAKKKDFSYYIAEREIKGDEVDVVVVGVLREYPFRKKVAYEWVHINLKDLAHLFCIEKYGRDCKETTLRFRREYLRAKIFGTRYAVGVALKRIYRNLLGEEVREKFDEEAEAVELSSIYRKIAVEPATDGQKKLIHKLLKERGVSEEEYRKLLRERYGVGSSLELTKEEASELISFLKERKEVSNGNNSP